MMSVNSVRAKVRLPAPMMVSLKAMAILLCPRRVGRDSRGKRVPLHYGIKGAFSYTLSQACGKIPGQASG